MSEENNGYLDSDQSFGNYYIRELGGTFAQLQDADPSLMLRQWWKMRKAAQGTSIGTTILGGAALAGGVMIGAPLLLGAGAIVGLGSGFLAWHHSKGASAHQLESEILDNCPMLIPLLVKLEESQMQRSELIAAYDSFMKAAIAGHIDSTNQNQIKGWFQSRIEQRAAFAQAATGFVKTQNAAPIAPAFNDAPMEDGSEKKHEVTLPALNVPQQSPAAAPIDTTSSDNNDSRPPAPFPSTDDRFAWVKDLLHFPAVLIWGPQGSGKTSYAAWLLHQRIAAGHTAEVWDVHREYGQWNGLAVYGDGMDYEAVDRRMNAFEHQVKADYKERAKNPNYNPTRHTIVCEEFTNFARRCENAAPFFEAALSDIRKIRKGVVFVSHDRSLAALGGSKGFSRARNNGLLELQLEAIIDPVTGDPTPAMKGKLKYPGKVAIEVEISTEMNGSMDFTSGVTQATQPQSDVRDRLENLFRTSETSRPQAENLQGSEEISTTPENEENQQESGFPALSKGEGNFHFEDFQLGKALFLAVKAEMENGKGKAAIVQEVLECPGRKYKYGCAWFDALMRKHDEK